MAQIHGLAAESRLLTQCCPTGIRAPSDGPVPEGSESQHPARRAVNMLRTAGHYQWKSFCYCLSPSLTFTCTFSSIKQKWASPLLSYIYINMHTCTYLYIHTPTCRNYTHRHVYIYIALSHNTLLTLHSLHYRHYRTHAHIPPPHIQTSITVLAFSVEKLGRKAPPISIRLG